MAGKKSTLRTAAQFKRLLGAALLRAEKAVLEAEAATGKWRERCRLCDTVSPLCDRGVTPPPNHRVITV